MQTFEREISFLSKTFDAAANNGVGEWILQEVKKVAKFKELDRTDKDQHKLHFKIVGMFSNSDKDDVNSKMELNSDAMYDLTTKAVRTLLIVDEGSFNSQEKEEFLADSGALLTFGMWIVGNKLMDFFSNLTQSSPK